MARQVGGEPGRTVRRAPEASDRPQGIRERSVRGPQGRASPGCQGPPRGADTGPGGATQESGRLNRGRAGGAEAGAPEPEGRPPGAERAARENTAHHIAGRGASGTLPATHALFSSFDLTVGDTLHSNAP